MASTDITSLIDITQYFHITYEETLESEQESPAVQLSTFQHESPVQWPLSVLFPAASTIETPEFDSSTLNELACKSCLRANALPWPGTTTNYCNNVGLSTLVLQTFDSVGDFIACGCVHSPTPIARPKLKSPHVKTNIGVHERNNEKELRLHVSNIPFQWTKEELATIFETYGTTYDVEIVYNGRGSKGFGFVTFVSFKSGIKAMTELNSKIVDGRRLAVNFAKPKQKIKHITPLYASKESPNRSINERAKPIHFLTPQLTRRQLRSSTAASGCRLLSPSNRIYLDM